MQLLHRANENLVYLTCGNDNLFNKFCDAAGCAHLPKDPRFATNPQRVAHRDVLVPILAEMVKRFGKGEWIDKLEAAGVPCGPINTIDQVFADPQVKHLGIAAPVSCPRLGETKMVATPINVAGFAKSIRGPTADAGAHTDAILGERLGYGAAVLADLRARGITGDAVIPPKRSVIS